MAVPSYHIYIPGISEIWKYPERKIKKTELNFNNLLSLELLSKQNLTSLVEKIESDLTDPLNQIIEIEQLVKYVSIYLNKESDYLNISIFVFLALVNIEIGNYEKAFYYFNIYMGKGEIIENTEYYSGVLLFLKLKSEKYSLQYIKETLIDFIGESLCEEILLDFLDNKSSFSYYTLPHCGDCSNCLIKSICLYEEWKLIIEKINTNMKINFPKQSDLQHLFHRED